MVGFELGAGQRGMRTRTTSACTTARRCAGGEEPHGARDDLHVPVMTSSSSAGVLLLLQRGLFEERYVREVQLLYTAPAWRPPALRTAPNHGGVGPELVSGARVIVRSRGLTTGA